MQYLQFVMICGHILSLHFQKSGLGKRIALRIMSLAEDKIGMHVLTYTGMIVLTSSTEALIQSKSVVTQASNWLAMLVTWLYAVWMMSTQATALMLPVADALVKQYTASFEENPVESSSSAKSASRKIFLCSVYKMLILYISTV